jgi:hypothetical protein
MRMLSTASNRMRKHHARPNRAFRGPKSGGRYEPVGVLHNGHAVSIHNRTRSPTCDQVVGPALTQLAAGRSPDFRHRRCRCRRASTKASFVVIISAKFVAEELPVGGTPSLQFPVQGWQPLAANRTT